MPERFLQIASLSSAADAHRVAVAGAHNPQRCGPPANEKFRTKWHLLMNTASPTASSDVSMPTNFNPRSPRGERRTLSPLTMTATYFNPRSPRGERRGFCSSAYSKNTISIHIPRVGNGTVTGAGRCRRWYFNPRSPYGERRRRLCKSSTKVYLKLTHSSISVHHPRKQYLTAL